VILDNIKKHELHIAHSYKFSKSFIYQHIMTLNYIGFSCQRLFNKLDDTFDVKIGAILEQMCCQHSAG